MSRIKELEEQITKLQEEKSKIYSDERKAVLIDIKEKIALFEFTAKELGLKLEKTLVGRKSRKEEKIARKKTASKKLAKKASSAAKSLNATLLVSTSRRTDSNHIELLKDNLEVESYFYNFNDSFDIIFIFAETEI